MRLSEIKHPDKIIGRPGLGGAGGIQLATQSLTKLSSLSLQISLLFTMEVIHLLSLMVIIYYKSELTQQNIIETLNIFIWPVLALDIRLKVIYGKSIV